MVNGIDTEFFKGNRDKLRSLFTGTAPIVLTANGLIQRNGDGTYPFRQDSSFWYLTGIDEPDVILVLDRYKEFLIVPSRDETRTAFDGKIDIAKLSQVSGVNDILDLKEGWKYLSKRFKKVRNAATLSAAPGYLERHGFYTNPARARLISEIKKQASDDLEILDLRNHLRRMRCIKQPQEIAAIQKAIDVTAQAINKVYKKRAKYEFEYEIEADLTSIFRKQGYNHAFLPITASGPNTCTMHSVKNDSPIDKNGLIILDIGAEVNSYAADITRTFAINEPTKRQQQIMNAVKEVHDFAVQELRPGVHLRDYENKVVEFLGEKLRELGLIKVISKDLVRKYYPHATSHFLGLDAHDAGDYERPLEPNMLITVEPGIYIPEEGIGVRIEDDVLVTEKGINILSQKLPKFLVE